MYNHLCIFIYKIHPTNVKTKEKVEFWSWKRVESVSGYLFRKKIQKEKILKSSQGGIISNTNIKM